jgi:uncharacterized membrane protein YkoI
MVRTSLMRGYPPMKKRNVLFLVVALMGAAATSIAFAAKDEKKAPAGSIRPAGTVAPSDLPGLAKITFQQALSAALKKAPGSIIKAELEVEDGNLMYSFEIVGANKKITEVEIDAGNGKVLNTEDEENEKEDKAAESKKK